MIEAAADNMRDGEARRPTLLRAAAEFCVLAGVILLILFWIVPAYISPGTNLGLPPAMLPVVCMVAIGILAVVQFAYTLLVTSARTAPTSGNAPLVITLLGITIGASILIDYVGLPVAGALLTGLTSFFLGERRLLVLAAMTLGGAGVMGLVVWSGL